MYVLSQGPHPAMDQGDQEDQDNQSGTNITC